MTPLPTHKLIDIKNKFSNIVETQNTNTKMIFYTLAETMGKSCENNFIYSSIK